MSTQKPQLKDPLLETYSRTETYVKKNQKNLIMVAGAIALIILGIFGYNQWIKAPKEVEANNQIYLLEQYFEKDSMDIVLNGNPKENVLGGIDFVDEYGGTKAGQRAAFMVGTIYFQKGEWAAAIDYLQKFDLKDIALYPNTLALIGDCHVELKEYDKALSSYKKAFSAGEKNKMSAPMILKKMGLVQEQLQDYKGAAASYTKIKTDYNETELARTIDLYINRALAKAGESNF